MGIWTLLIMLLLVFQLKYAQAQVSVLFDARNVSPALHAVPSASNNNMAHRITMSPSVSPRLNAIPRNGYLQLNQYRGSLWSTFSLRYNNGNAGDDWLNEHNLVMVKSVIQIVNRLVVGINCHYNWSFTIAGNGAGMMLNKLPFKIYFAGVVGDAPNLGHR